MTDSASILVAEDSKLLRRMIGDVLRERGYEVREAADGTTAVQACREEPPGVLLLARELAGLDGLAVLDILRSDPATSGIPVVFVTGHTDAADLAETLERGAHDYVRKPVDPVELVARVRTALRLSALRAELAARNAELEALARTDTLTGLANRRHADDMLRATVAGARRHDRTLSVALLDIDRFKSVNDRYGHAAGDTVLREVAKRLTAHLREEDLAARWGGEEFLLLMPDTDDGVTACERLRKAIADDPILLPDGTPLNVTASFGTAQWAPGEDPEALVARADKALYAAKESGRNRVVSAEIQQPA
jgi:diguanylate cyclase (GGDEF)-like protein